MTGLRFFTHAARAVAVASTALSAMVAWDWLGPDGEADQGTVARCERGRGRQGPYFAVEIRGRRVWSESMGPSAGAELKAGDVVCVTFTPVFHEWKRIERVGREGVVYIGRGLDMYWMAAMGVVFLLPLASFVSGFPGRFRSGQVVLWAAIGTVAFATVALWIKLVLTWGGAFEYP